jgi:hypothetical protein
LCHIGPLSTSYRIGPRPIKPTTTYFHQYFHQILKHLIIFTNNLSFSPDHIFTSHNYTNKLIFVRPLPDRPLERAMLVTCRVLGWCLRHSLVPQAMPAQAMGRATRSRAAWPCLRPCHGDILYMRTGRRPQSSPIQLGDRSGVRAGRPQSEMHGTWFFRSRTAELHLHVRG